MLGPTTIAHSLREFLQRSEDRPLPLQTLVQAANHTDPYEVAGVVADFVKDGLLEQYVVVVSPSGNGPLGEYPSILNVPERLPDPYTGQDFRVTLESLQIFYRLPRR